MFTFHVSMWFLCTGSITFISQRSLKKHIRTVLYTPKTLQHHARLNKLGTVRESRLLSLSLLCVSSSSHRAVSAGMTVKSAATHKIRTQKATHDYNKTHIAKLIAVVKKSQSNTNKTEK